MPFGSRYTRVDPSHGIPEESQSFPQAMEFSNDIYGSNPPKPPMNSYNSASKFLNSTYRDSSGDYSHPSSEIPSYEPYGNQFGNLPPTKPVRRRTQNSFLSSLSSAFTVTRDGVSHFRIPKLAAPWEHEMPEKDGLDSSQASTTVREFDHRRQRRRLFVNSSFRLLTTAFLCVALAGVLYGFSTITGGMSQPQKKGFNALITGLSIVLGLNLSSSLKGYAQMMRWRFLAAGYRNLQDFELVMQCESQQAVVRLLWAGRTPGQIYPNKTQVLATVWLTINVALQVVTALLGLTYSIDISEQYVFTRPGNITVADLRRLNISTTDDDSTSLQGAVAQGWGITGQDYGVLESTWDAYEGQQQAIYTDPSDYGSMYWYTFIDQDEAGKETVVSSRKISSTATCRTYPVLKGGYAGFDNVDANQSVTIQLDDGSNSTFDVPLASTGGTTWMINPNDTAFTDGSRCGPRCAYVWALQSAIYVQSEDPWVRKPRFWECQNNISHVSNVEYYGSAEEFDLADLQAFIWAGAIAFSGTTYGDMQFVLYPPYTYWGPKGTISEHDMAGRVMQFSIGGIAALDRNNVYRPVVQNEQRPYPAQVVNVDWLWAAVVLGSIPLTQAIVLILVIGWANKAVIKDTSFLATARLLKPVIDKLGNRGCLLTGDEIAEELGNYKVVYGPRMPRGTPRGQEANVLKHIDVIAEEEDIERWHGRMPAGRYDGTSTWEEGDVKDSGEMELLIEEDRKARPLLDKRKSVKRRMSF